MMNQYSLTIEHFDVLGFTGTQKGMTKEQVSKVIGLLTIVKPIGHNILHHGDCTGADEDVHNIAIEMGYRIVVHPPEDNSKRAFCTGPKNQVTVLDPLPYMARNLEIVKHCTLLLATPKEMKEQRRSGTWATARKAPEKTLLVFPDGSIERMKWDSIQLF